MIYLVSFCAPYVDQTDGEIGLGTGYRRFKSLTDAREFMNTFKCDDIHYVDDDYDPMGPIHV